MIGAINAKRLKELEKFFVKEYGKENFELYQSVCDDLENEIKKSFDVWVDKVLATQILPDEIRLATISSVIGKLGLIKTIIEKQFNKGGQI